MEDFIELLSLDEISYIILSILFLLVLIQCLFYFLFYNKPYTYHKNKGRDFIQNTYSGVSVIITVKNEISSLKKNLPLVLEQDYKNYEVIVVNYGAKDDTEVFLNGLQQTHSNLYHTFLPNSNDRTFSKKKLALTLGIKAAKNDILLFIEPDGAPEKTWISSMMQKMSGDKDIVLGYVKLKKRKGFFSKIIRFDSLLFQLKYLDMAIMKKPFIGTYYNVAYRKKLFFENKGFADVLNYDASETVFLNRIMNASNTAVSLSPSSFVSTEFDFRKWKEVKAYYKRVTKISKNHTTLYKFLGLGSLLTPFFYILLVAGIGYSIFIENWVVLSLISLLFILKMVLQLPVLNRWNRLFDSGKFIFSFPFVEFLQPFFSGSVSARKKD